MNDVEIQTGLFVHRYSKSISGREYTFGNLYSSDGYEFYDKSFPEEERLPMRYRTLTTDEAELSDAELSELFISVPIEDTEEGS